MIDFIFYVLVHSVYAVNRLYQQVVPDAAKESMKKASPHYATSGEVSL